MYHRKKYLVIKELKILIIFNDVQEEEEECVSNEHMGYTIVS